MYQHIKTFLAQASGIPKEDSIILERPKNKDLGHLATPLAFSLAKIKKTSPMLIAQELAEKLSQYKEFDKV